MSELVIVPTYNRSEMLYLVLEAIRAASPSIPVHVFPDRGTREDEACALFDVQQHLTWAHSYHGNTANVMEAIKWASKQRAEIVYIIEDDAIIHPSFFVWARTAIHANPTAFAACGWRYSPDALPPADGPDILIPWYLSVATALPRRSILSLAEHASLAYYSNMAGYLDSRYPTSVRRGTLHFEQDGLALRVMESQSRYCAWPRRPRCTHIGFHGYHMPNGQPLPGTLQERVRILRLIIENPSLLASLMSGGPMPEISRCITCNKPLLTQNPAARLECVECYHAIHSDSPRTSDSHYYFPPLPVTLEVTSESLNG